MCEKMDKKTKGFTLIELAIVMLVLAVVIGGVVMGQHLIRNTQVQTVIYDANQYRVAVNNFKLQYDAIPGDFRSAEEYWPGETFNGNGNHEVHHNPNNNKSEPILFWKHLTLSGLLPGSYTGEPVPIYFLEAGTNLPLGAFTGTAWNVIYTRSISVGGSAPDPEDPASIWADPTDGIYGRIANVLELSADNNKGGIEGKATRPIEAWTIDRKVDDGVAYTGNTYGTNATVLGATGCIDEFDKTGYNLIDDNIQCSMYFWLD